MFTLDIDLYFWMIDRGDLEDDQRNKVEIEQQRVKLHREYSQRLENAFYVARLMQVIRKTIIKKSKKPFTLDASINSLKDQTTAVVKLNNWNLVVQELRKFGVRISKEQKAQIIGGKHSLIHDIIQKLHDFDQNILNLPTVAGPIGAIYNKQGSARNRKQDAHSEMDLGLQQNSIMEPPSRAYDEQTYQNLTHQRDEFLEGDRLMGLGRQGGPYQQSRQSAAILMDAPTRKSRLEPIDHGQYNQSKGRNGALQSPLSLNNLNQMDNSALVAGIDFDTIDAFAAQNSASGQAGGVPDSHQFLNQQFDNLLGTNQQDDIDQNTMQSTAYPDGGYDGQLVGLSECVNTLNFILESLSQSLGLTQSQAAALLTNNQKYLMHLCMKGMKGKDYSKLITWYKLIMHNSWKLVDLLNAEKDDVKSLGLTLDVIRCGLFSNEVEVANLCCRTLTKISSLIYDRSASDEGGNSLQPQFWEWLNNKQQRPSQNQGNPVRSPSPKKSKKSNPTKKQQELESLIDETGLQSFIRAQRIHQTDFVEFFTAALVQFGRDNYVELFTSRLKHQSADDLEYLRLIQDIQGVLCSTSRGRIAFIESGAFHVLVDMCLKLTDTQASASVAIDLIQVALSLLVDFWKTRPEIVQSRQNGGRMTDAIIQALKRGCRDLRSKSIRISAINLMFTLLDGFAGERNQFAPLIYKALTFVLIDVYMNQDLREEMLKNFIILFQKHQNIPIGILCEPLLKQIQINLDKQDYAESQFRHNQNILQPQSEHFTLNTTDFELFLTISIHPKLTALIAVQLLEIVSQIARKNIIFTRVSLKLLLTVLARYQNNMKVYEHCQTLVTQHLAIILEQDTIKTDTYNALLQRPRGRILTRKKSVAGQSNGQGEFNLYMSGATSHNIKYQPAMVQAPRFGNPTDENTIDDSHLQSLLNPNDNQEESAQYMSLKTSEKLIVNLLQCLIQSGIKVLVDYIRGQVLDLYLKIEKKLKFRNKGLLYLLGLFDKDVNKLVQFAKQKLNKERASKPKKKQIMDQRSKLATDHGPQDRSAISASPYEFDRDNQVFDASVADSFDRDLNEQTLQVPDFNSQSQVNSKHLPPVSPGSYSYDVDRLSKGKKAEGRALSIPASVAAAKQDLNPFGAYDSPTNAAKRQRSQVDLTLKERQLYQRAGSEVPYAIERNIKLYDINQDSEDEQKQYLSWVKERLKLYKTMFNKYASTTNEKSRVQSSSFGAMLDQKKCMSLATVYQFLADFKISKAEFASREEIKKIIKLINLKQESNLKTVSNLDVEGFIEFVLQLGYFMHRDQTEKPSQFMPMLFERLKESSLASKVPLFQRLFEDPQAPSIGDPQVIRQLTELVNKDSSFELPPGYVKVRADKPVPIDGPDPSKYRYESEQISAMVLDDVFLETFGVNLLDPAIRYEERYIVKPDIFVKQRSPRNSGAQNPYRNQSQARSPSKGRKKAQEYIRESLLTPGGDTTEGTYENRIQPKNRYTRHQTSSLSTSVDIQPQKSLVGKQSSYRKQYQSPSASPRRKGNPNYNFNTDAQDYQDADLVDTNDGYDLEDRQRAPARQGGGLPPRSPQKLYSGPVNKVMQHRLEQQQLELEDHRLRDQRLAKRQDTVKKQLQEARASKLSKDAIEQQRKRQELEQQKLKEQKQIEAKKEYYNELRRQYEEERLPQIRENQVALEQLRKEEQDEVANKKRAARQRIENNSKNLSEQFKQIQTKREGDKQSAAQEELQLKRKETIKKQIIAEKAKKVGATAKASKMSRQQSNASLGQNSLSPRDFSGIDNIQKSIQLQS